MEAVPRAWRSERRTGGGGGGCCLYVNDPTIPFPEHSAISQLSLRSLISSAADASFPLASPGFSPAPSP